MAAILLKEEKHHPFLSLFIHWILCNTLLTHVRLHHRASTGYYSECVYEDRDAGRSEAMKSLPSLLFTVPLTWIMKFAMTKS